MTNNVNSADRIDQTDDNRDPLSGELGAHPVGTGVGAAGAGGVATVIGGIVGATLGSVVGGLVGKNTAEQINPTDPTNSEDSIEEQHILSRNQSS